MALDAGWWRGKRVLVTGHTGFKGSWLAIWLQRLGAAVTGYALPPATAPNLYDAARVGSSMDGVMGDVRDVQQLCAVMERSQPEIVLHLAAQSLVRYSFAHPRETFETNVIGTANVLEAVRQTPSVRAVVAVTSDKCYAVSAADRRHAEDDPLGGPDPYSASKAGAELVTAGLRAALFAPRSAAGAPAIATARAGNVIGGGDWAMDRLLPDLLAAFAAHRPARIRNPGAVRPWQHVLDPLRGYLLLARRLCESGDAFAQAWNFGPPESHEKPVAWVADTAASEFGEGARWERDASDHPKETATLRLDSAKAYRLLAWRTALALPEAIKRTTAWHRAFDAGAQARELVEREIAQYESAVNA
jgi:CDP-glucose 4,6-dehydratase